MRIERLLQNARSLGGMHERRYVVDPILWTTDPSNYVRLGPGRLLLAGCRGESSTLGRWGLAERSGARPQRPAHLLSWVMSPASRLGLVEPFPLLSLFACLAMPPLPLVCGLAEFDCHFSNGPLAPSGTLGTASGNPKPDETVPGYKTRSSASALRSIRLPSRNP